MQFGFVGTMLLDLSLSMCYFLMIEWTWNERHLRSLEPWFHAVTWPAAVLPAVYLLVRQMYARARSACWIASCDDDPLCEMHHSQALLFRAGVHILSLFHIACSLYVFSRVYRFAISTDTEGSYIVARKGMLYAMTVTTVQIPLLIVKILELALSKDLPDAAAIASCTISLNGLLNMLVFMVYRRDMHTWYGRLWRRILDVCSCGAPKQEAAEPQPVGRDLFLTTVTSENETQNPTQ